VRTTSANSVRTKREQRTNNARTAYELRANYARTAYEQRANYERELTRELRDARPSGPAFRLPAHALPLWIWGSKHVVNQEP